MNKFFLVGLLGFFTVTIAEAQDSKAFLTGRVSYITAQNIYVKFISTEKINEGDTIFFRSGQLLKPCLLVEGRSSISVVGKPLANVSLNIDDVVVARIHSTVLQPDIQASDTVKVTSKVEIAAVDIPAPKDTTKAQWKQDIRGSATVSSYSNISNTAAEDSYRMRYSLSMQAEHLGNTRFSADSYITFSHTFGKWAEIQSNVFNALKIYSLAVGSDFGDHSSIWIGRKINTNLANIGAVDGIQAETQVGRFRTGLVIGSRPDFQSYGVNVNLGEFGGFLSHEFSNNSGRIQTSLAFFEQRNTGLTDRRFVYFQHDNSIVKNLNLFTSCELDLYRVQEGVAMNKLSLTSLYVSLRYRPFRTFSVTASYDARKNVIYYETFKSYADQLLDEATRQGMQLRVNYRPWNTVSLGVTASYRNRSGDISPNENLNGYITFTQIPWINATATLTANLLKTGYLDGQIYGLQLNRDFLKGKFYGGLNYRFIDYRFINSATTLVQHIAQVDLSWRISKKASLSANYELTLERSGNYHRIYLSFVQRL